MPGAKYARASDMMVAGAARRLIDECKDGDLMQGGVSYNIGKRADCHVIARIMICSAW